MVFTSTVTRKTVQGNRKVIYGTFTNTGGSSGGDIVPGLKRMDYVQLQYSGTSVLQANSPVINETFPFSGTACTIVTETDANGHWVAVGR